MILLRIFYEFFKIGLFAVGGGLAVLPFLSRMSADTGWFSQADIADMLAVSEAAPGPVGVDLAVYAGYKAAGLPGALAATAGLVTPSIIIVLIVAGFIKAHYNSPYMQAAFYGLRPVSTALISSAALVIMAGSFLNAGVDGAPLRAADALNYKALALAAAIAALSNIKKLRELHPAVFIAAAAVAGIVFEIN
jgi:chromate transporter